MRLEQFEKLAALLRMKIGSAQYNAARLYFVERLSIIAAAREAGADYAHAWRAVTRINKALADVKIIAGV